MVAALIDNFGGQGPSSASLAHGSYDVAVVGGGPAGLSTAIVAAQQGLSVAVLERREGPPDKACGEGILPPGVRALERLGVLDRISASDFHPFAGIRFIQEDGCSLEALLPYAGGLGIRRTVLIEALARRAAQLGAVLHHRCDVLGVRRTSDQSIIQTAAGRVGARLVVAADGLHSPLRRAAALDAASHLPRRFALRQHYRVAPWTDLVEVYVDRNGEAVVTPVGRDTVSVNFTWRDGTIARPGIASLAARFPGLRARLGTNTATTRPMGAGPMARAAKRRASDGLVLIGDAAGFVDSISGDGLSIAFNSALILGAHLGRVLAESATRKSLVPYERAAGRLFRGYWIVTNSLLWLARHPRSRAATIRFLSERRWILAVAMRRAMSMMMTAE